MRVALVLPAYNEAEDLPGLLTALEDLVRDPHRPDPLARVLVVDDGSSDQTCDIAERAAKRLPIGVISHERNQGLGATLRTGLNHVLDDDSIDVIITMDADNTHDPLLIPAMVECLRGGADLVIASRFAPGGREIGVPLVRKALSRGASLLFRVRFPFGPVRDYTCGYRAYKCDLLHRMRGAYGREGLISASGFDSSVELLLKARACKAMAVEVPLVLRYDQKLAVSKMKVRETIGRLLRTLSGSGYASDEAAG